MLTLNIPETSNGLVFVNILKDNKTVPRLTIEGQCENEILVTEYGHSILISLDPSSFKTIDEIRQCFDNLPDDFDFKDPENDGKMFFKLPIKNDKYTCLIEPPVSAKTPENSEFQKGAKVTISLTPKAYFNFDDSKCGVFFKIHKITIDNGKKKKLRK
jgi:hypothetical protein